MSGLGTEARQLAEEILAAIDLPFAATTGDEKIRDKILYNRLFPVVVALEAITGAGPNTPLEWQLDWLRGEIAKYPATGYKTWKEACAEREAAADAH